MNKDRDDETILSDNTFPVVGIGASAGGLDAFKKLLKAIPADSGMAYVLVQHLAPDHQSILPELLQKVTSIPVSEITDNVKVQPNNIYIIPSNKLLVANDGVLQLSPRPSKSRNERNLPIDLFFTSLAEVHGTQAIGVVLSGTASDGTAGLKAIKEYGGITFAQDEASAQYDSMPQSAALAGVVDFILPPEDMPKKIAEVTRYMARSEQELEQAAPQEEAVFKKILFLLRNRRGTDFTYYKQTTIRRRILRRVALNKSPDLVSYVLYLQGNKTEQDALYQDLLIPVTQFFRDAAVFDALCGTILPRIVAGKQADEPIRIWVAACSTGEEAYSIAMCLKEVFGESRAKVQIFATDISEPAIAKARRGIYEKAETAAVSPQRLSEFFTKVDGSYLVNKQIRDMCIFASHNFLKDPPFGRIDLVSCRNVLIYLEPYLQKKALTTFHYALNPKGFLLLGKSETTNSVSQLFGPASKHEKLFSRKDVPGRFPNISGITAQQKSSGQQSNNLSERMQTDFQKTADDILLSQYTPAGVVVNDSMDIVHFRGSVDAYLVPAPGKPTHNLLKMARNGLAFELRNIIHKAKHDHSQVVKENISIQVGGSQRMIRIEAIPLPNIVEPHYLILFQESVAQQPADPAAASGDVSSLRIQTLEKELSELREDMRSITEVQEAANEELQSANEELLSSSEEMQSLNEELETSKEELQSSNEELTVVNQEIAGLNEQITEARNYAESIIANMSVPLLVLDNALRIKSANRAFYRTYNVNEAETEGRLIYDLGNGQWDIGALRAPLEQILSEKSKITDYEVGHIFPSIGKRTMLLNAHEIISSENSEKLILLTIEDITERRQALDERKESEDRFRSLIEEAPVATCLFEGREMRINIANEMMLGYWGKGKSVIGLPLATALPELKTQAFPEILNDVFSTGKSHNAKAARAELTVDGVSRTYYFDYSYKPLRNAAGEIYGIMNMAVDVTDEVISRQKIAEAESSLRGVIELANLGTWHLDLVTGTIDYSPRLKAWLGIGENEIIDPRIFSHHISEGDRARLQAAILHAITPGTDGMYELEFHVATSGNLKARILHAQGKAFFNPEGRAYKVTGTIQDVTQQRTTQAALEDLVWERTAALADQAEELAESNKQLIHSNEELAQYAYVASHDLQEPLRKIRVFTGMLSNLIQENEESRPLIGKISQSAERMSELIKALLEFSRLIKGDVERGRADLNDILMEVMRDFELTKTETEALVDIGKLPEIEAVSIQMSQLFYNLIGNALKFARAGEAPRVTVTAVPMSIEEVRQFIPKPFSSVRYYHISVADNGIGFEPQYSEQIFEIFKRLHTRDIFPGSGIVLALCRRIVVNHNGHLYAVSEPGQGSVFHIILPERQREESFLTTI